MKNNKSLGQHWLKNREILEYIADEASAGDYSEKQGLARDLTASALGQKKPLCVEIGPGLGTLTSSLLKRFDRVIAVEYDAQLAANLPKSFPGKNLEVVNEDFLKFDLREVPASYVVAGNIPYYITSPIIEHILSAKNLPERVVLLMQKEVAERIVSEKETVLSLSVKNRVTVRLGAVVPKDEFTPPPKVDSQVVIFEPFRDGPVVSEEVFGLIQRGFVAPRKKLVHNLVGLKSKDETAQIFRELGISLDARPGDLKLADWKKLYENM